MATSAIDPSALPVADGESPWTAEELDEVRAELNDDVERLTAIAEDTRSELEDLVDEGDTGDTIDIGSAQFERDQERSLALGAAESLRAARQALERIGTGEFGRCEQCGEAIGKGRMQVFPRATMCLACKQRAERR